MEGRARLVAIAKLKVWRTQKSDRERQQRRVCKQPQRKFTMHLHSNSKMNFFLRFRCFCRKFFCCSRIRCIHARNMSIEAKRKFQRKPVLLLVVFFICYTFLLLLSSPRFFLRQHNSIWKPIWMSVCVSVCMLSWLLLLLVFSLFCLLLQTMSVIDFGVFVAWKTKANPLWIRLLDPYIHIIYIFYVALTFTSS